MALGPNRSPHQTFPRSTFEPQRSDRDLLPKSEITRPSKQRQIFGPDREFAGGTQAGRLKPAGAGPYPSDLFSATDIEGLPWIRKTGNEWTEAAFRAIVRTWLAAFFRARRGRNLLSWQIEEIANSSRMGSLRLPADQHFLRLTVTQRVGEALNVVEVSMPFARADREDPGASRRLAILATSVDAQLT